MITKALVAALVVSVLFSTVPLPHSQEGRVTVPSGGEWSYSVDLEASAHVTCIVRSGALVDVAVVREEATGPDDATVNTANGTYLYRSTESLGPGHYRLVVTNSGASEVGIEYQVHEDYIVVANMTAKNVMGLSLALSMTIVALFLYSRPRRP